MQPANSAPTANAGPDQNAVTGQPVTLDGSASSDPNNDPLTFSWVFLSVAPGSALTNADIVNPTTPAPSFTPDVDGPYELQLTVSDGTLSDTDTVVITAGTPNAAPTANAGPDQNAVTGQPVTLDGSSSSDPNGNTITFSWRFLSAPLTSSLTDADIVNPTTPAPSFTPDVDGAYELELTVTDVPGGLSDTDTVIITATSANVAPNADAGLDQTAEVNQLVTVDGSNSSDPDAGPFALTFQWVFATVAPGSALTDADINNPTSPQASFTPDVTGVYTLTLTVSDGDLTDSDDVAINVTPVNVPPNADAGADVLVQLGEVATLNGSASNDPDNFPAPLTFQWSFVSVAAGSTLTNANITNATTPTPSFTPDQPGMYTLQLQVSDGAASDSDEVMVKANAAPVAVDDTYTTDEDTELNEPAPGVLTNDTDANNDALTAVLDTGPSNAASFTLNPDGSFDYEPNPDFSGEDSFTYHANDDGANGGNGADSNVATVTITVTEVNDAPVANDDGGPTFTTNEDGGPFAGPSVLTNDTDPEDDPLTAVLNTGPTNASAFTLNPDGTFSYTPNADFFGDDTFTYHATDGNTPNPDSNVATVTITVNAVNDAPSFVSGGDVTVDEDSGVAGAHSLAWASAISPGPGESGQTVSFNVSNGNNALFSVQPAISGSGTLSFTLASNANGSALVTVTAQDTGGIANGGDDTSDAQTFTITVTPVNDAPVAQPKSFAAQANMKIVGLTGFLTGVLDADAGTGSPACDPTPFALASASATSPPGGTVTITSASTGTVDFDPPPGATGNVTFTYTVSDNGCPGSATSLPATATVTVNGPVIWFVNSTVAAGGNGTLSNPFNLLSSADAVDAATHGIFLYEGTYTTGLVLNSSEKLIGQGVTGTTFDALFGISPPLGTIMRPTFTGTRPSVGGTVTVNANSVVRGLNIASTTLTGLSGGAVAGVSVSEASVTSTTGTAVNLNGTGGTVVLTSVSANGAPNGIVLNGTSGPFTVLSTGAAGSGGLIQGTVGHGIALTNTQNVSLDRMSIQTTGGSGISGTLVTNFTFTNGTINNAGNFGQESAIAFNGNGSLLGNNIAGTLTVTGNSFTNPFYSGLDVQSDNGTVSNANVSNNTVTNPGFSGINFVGTNNASTVFNLTRATVNQNNVLGSGGNGIQFSISASNATGPGATAGTPGTADIISITNNSVSLDGTGTQAITVANSGGNSGSRTKTNFLIECNGKSTGGCTAPTANPLTGSLIGNVVLIGNNGFSDMTGTVNNNVIDANHTPGTAGGGGNGISGGNGVSGAGNAWTPNLTLTVTNNVITDTNGNGILLVGRQTSGIAKLKIAGNNVAAPNAASVRPGIRVDAGNSSSADDAVCLNISGNTSAGSLGSDGIGVRKEGTVATTNDFGIQGISQTSPNNTQVETFIETQNPAGGGALVLNGMNFVQCSTAPP